MARVLNYDPNCLDFCKIIREITQESLDLGWNVCRQRRSPIASGTKIYEDLDEDLAGWEVTPLKFSDRQQHLHQPACTISMVGYVSGDAKMLCTQLNSSGLKGGMGGWV